MSLAQAHFRPELGGGRAILTLGGCTPLPGEGGGTSWRIQECKVQQKASLLLQVANSKASRILFFANLCAREKNRRFEGTVRKRLLDGSLVLDTKRIYFGTVQSCCLLHKFCGVFPRFLSVVFLLAKTILGGGKHHLSCLPPRLLSYLPWWIFQCCFFDPSWKKNAGFIPPGENGEDYLFV